MESLEWPTLVKTRQNDLTNHHIFTVSTIFITFSVTFRFFFLFFFSISHFLSLSHFHSVSIISLISFNIFSIFIRYDVNRVHHMNQHHHRHYHHLHCHFMFLIISYLHFKLIDVLQPVQELLSTTLFRRLLYTYIHIFLC